MGSLLISDVLTEPSRFPHTMLAGGAHQATSERSYRSSASDRAPQISPNNPHQVPPRQTPSSLPTSDPRAAQHSPHGYAQHQQVSLTHSTSPIPIPSTSSGHHTTQPSRAPIRQAFPTQQYLPQPPNVTEQLMQPTPPYDSSQPQSRGGYQAPPSTNQGFYPARPMNEVAPITSNKIQVRDLAHIQSFANDEFLDSPSLPRTSRHSTNNPNPQYEISGMPVEHIIEMVAGLLTKITNQNDQQHEQLRRHIPPPEGTTGLSQQTTSVLAFHGKNVPSITIMSYLSRIHKYCPTTYEVFLSLLVYFDRMTVKVNKGPRQHLEQQPTLRPRLDSADVEMADQPPTLPDNSSVPMEDAGSNEQSSSQVQPELGVDADPYDLSHFFVVDSFNIHRLVIAGVTCASKFFSDVFYTNSRYAKVCSMSLRIR